MSRVLPILFNTEMVKAIVRQMNPKTATRRIVRGFIPNDAIWGYTIFTPKGCISCRGTFADGYGEKFFKLPYQIEDILYVRETWKCWRAHRYEATADIMYKAGGEGIRLLFANGSTDLADRNDYDSFISKWFGQMWHPSIHMPKEAARIWLKVTDVRVERLQDITHIDIIMEGFVPEYLDAHSGEKTRNDFARLWDSTIDKTKRDLYGWKANPWVWVIEFERCEKPEPCILKGMEPAEDKRPCIGCGDAWADEPCEMCKGCRQCTGSDED